VAPPVPQPDDLVVHDRPLAEVDPVILYGILRLRSAVFVVEQDCVFLDPDGRDLEPGCRQLWLAGPDGEVVATARILDDGDRRTIGRIVTDRAHRSAGLAARLLDHALATSAPPWHLEAQARLAAWYERFGFEVAGAEYVEDGIAHVPMRRSR
jgi:ElaA protein